MATIFAQGSHPRPVVQQTSGENPTGGNPANAAGELFFENRDVDLGTIKEAVTRDISLVNGSKGAVRIVGVHPSCNCAGVELSKSVLGPGERASITVRIEPRPERIGLQRYSIELDYIGECRATTRLQLRADYRPDLIFPARLSIRSVAGRGGNTSFSITDFRSVAFEFKEIETSCPELRVTVVERPSVYSPGWRYQLAAAWKPSNRSPGQYGETIILKTDYAGKETIAIPVTVQEVPRLRVVPEILFLKASPNNDRVFEGRLIVDDSDGEPVSLDCVKTSCENLQCEYPSKKARQLMIGVKLKGDGLPGGDIPLILEICTKEPAVETARIRVRVGS